MHWCTIYRSNKSLPCLLMPWQYSQLDFTFMAVPYMETDTEIFDSNLVSTLPPWDAKKMTRKLVNRAFEVSHSITVMSYEHHGISYHQQIDCLFNILFGLRKMCILDPLWGETLVIGGFPTQRASNAESIPIPWHHHGISTGPMASTEHYI